MATLVCANGKRVNISIGKLGQFDVGSLIDGLVLEPAEFVVSSREWALIRESPVSASFISYKCPEGSRCMVATLAGIPILRFEPPTSDDLAGAAEDLKRIATALMVPDQGVSGVDVHNDVYVRQSSERGESARG